MEISGRHLISRQKADAVAVGGGRWTRRPRQLGVVEAVLKALGVARLVAAAEIGRMCMLLWPDSTELLKES
jgi:hypothetical protein